MTPRAWTPRAWLFVPGDSPDKMAKAWGSGADALILDLEDSVAEPRKAHGRAAVRDYLADRQGAAGPELWVRINPLASPHALADLAAVVSSGPAGIVLPKSASGADVVQLGHYLSALEAAAGRPPGGARILPIATETPASLFGLGSYVGASPRLAGLTWGAEDLPAAIGATANRTASGDFTDLLRLARSLCLAGAAAAGAPAIETVYTAIRDLDGLKAYAEAGRREGFAGMMAVHPAQVETINRAFTPGPEALERARRIVALFAADPTAGVLSLDGEMLDLPHLKQAQRLLATAGG